MSRSKGALNARIVYLLDGAPLFGGVKVVLDQANLLAEVGYDVTVRCTTAKPDWMEVACRWEEGEDLARPLERASAEGRDTIVIGTYWTTLRSAAILGRNRAVHYCQGYEATYTHNQSEHPAIAEAYSLPLPAITVSSHLSEILQAEYGRRSEVVRQPLPSGYRPVSVEEHQRRLNSRVPPRVLLMSPLQIDWKGVATGLEALSLLRDRGLEFDLVRISQLEQTDEERAFSLGGEYHRKLRPTAVQEIIRQCDLLLAPSWEAEGFGLPVLEALASGVPVVASDIRCFGAWTRGATVLAPAKEPQLFADAIERVLQDPALQEDLRGRGLELAKRYSPGESVASFERAMRRLFYAGE